MKRITAMLLCFILLCSLFGCQNEAISGNTLTEQQLYEELFDIVNKIELRLDMTDEELAKMQADYEAYDLQGSKSPIYRIGKLTVTITTPENVTYTHTIDEVGVRMKGNTSRTDFYSKEDGIYNIIHLKLSFQETFDDADYYGADAQNWTEEARSERKNRTFATLEKLDLRWNRCDDGTYLKEYFAYETYRQYGVLAPRTNLASFDWAGTHMGVFTINEPVDEAFLAKNLPQEALGGDLYKIGWAGNQNGSFTSTKSIGIENEDTGSFYAYDLKTNKKTSEHQSLINLIQKLNSGNVTKESFAELVDMETFLPFCAVSYLLGNPDDLRNNYNNSYIYFRADDGKAVLIPYDYDRCLGITAHWNPTGDGVTSDNPFSLKQAATNSTQESPLFQRSVTAGGFYVREYAQILDEIANSEWFTYQNFEQLYRVAQANYGSLTQPGKVFRNTEGLYLCFDLNRTSDFSSNGNISMKEYLDAKNNTLTHYLAEVDKYADFKQETPATWYIRCDMTNWQNDSDYAMTEKTGLVSIQINVHKQIRLKVYHDKTGRWYGSECISEDSAVPFATDAHTNIILNEGSYRITFDPTTETITLEYA